GRRSKIPIRIEKIPGALDYRQCPSRRSGGDYRFIRLASQFLDQSVPPVGQRFLIVATFEDSSDFPPAAFRSQTLQSARHRGKPLFIDPHHAERVAVVAVEACRNKNELGFENSGNWQHQMVENVEILVVTTGRGQRGIHRVSQSGTLADLVEPSSPRIKRV